MIKQINKTRIKHEIRKELFATLYFSSSCPVQGTVQKGIISSDRKNDLIVELKKIKNTNGY